MSDSITPKYRFITTDLLTNRILSEVPFTGVSYTNALTAAGQFSGTVFVDSESKKLDLYESTKPGKVGLYILRNNECVWGGIIWSREYDINSRSLAVSGLEFTSYFHHRRIWKTFSTTFGGSLFVPETATAESRITLSIGTPYTLPEGSSIKVIFDEPNQHLTTYFEVLTGSSPTSININPKDRFYRITHKQVTALASDISTATVRLTTASNHGMAVGDTITIANTGIVRLNGTRTVAAIHNSKSFSVKVPSSDTTQKLNKKDANKVAVSAKATATLNGSVPPGTYTVSVDVKPDTYSFVVGLIESTMNDFTGLGFPNYAIEAGDKSAHDVRSYKCDGGVAVIETGTPHGFSVGQAITVKNLDKSLNGSFTVSEIIDDFVFSYEAGSNAVSFTRIDDAKQFKIIKKRTRALLTTYTFEEPHTYLEGDIVSIRNVPDQIQSYVQKGKAKTKTHVYNESDVEIQSVPSPTQIIVKTKVTFDDAADLVYTTYRKDPNAYAISYPLVVSGSYGPFPNSTDIGITFEESDRDLLGVETESQLIRGFEVKSVGEVLEAYSVAGNGGAGFDYRIECRYDADLHQFTRVFRFIPFLPANIIFDDSSDIVTELGADQLTFEFPGNISSVVLSENAEDAATRMFMVGNLSELSSEASQPYSAAALGGYLAAGWPILDGAESTQDTGDEFLLYAYASKYLGESAPPISDFSIDINGSLDPVVGTYTPGQWCSIIIDDEFFRLRLASDDEPRDDVLVRKITAITVNVPDTGPFPESVTLELLPVLKVGG